MIIVGAVYRQLSVFVHAYGGRAHFQQGIGAGNEATGLHIDYHR